ncbi:MAG: galactokinase [Anaerolineae bacterium]
MTESTTLEERASYLRTRFHQVFGREAATVVRAPGRVNLIGEHTDYNDGYVLPIAIDRSILVATAPRDDRRVVLHSLDFDEGAQFSLDDIRRAAEGHWSNYERGVALYLQERGVTLTGLEAVITGDVPIGSGLSSSAAVEVVTAYAFQVLSGFDLSRVEMALICQRAENRFVGMNCGIMDQFISALGQRDRALLIDCRSLDYELVPIPAGVKIIVCDTGVRRGLVDSEYNARRQECEEGVRTLGEHLPGVKALRDVSVSQFERYKDELPKVVQRRCRHVINENDRVLRGVEALKKGDLAGFGQLMNESHISLRDDYEVSCRELDIMVEAAWAIEGTYGSRLTGAGFGGCTVSLVADEAVETFQTQVAEAYQAATGLKPQIYVCRAEEGASEIKLK